MTDQAHDPHFVATLNEKLVEYFAETDVPYSFAVGTDIMPVGPQQTVFAILITVWRPAMALGEVASYTLPVVDFHHLTDDDIFRKMMLTILGQVTNRYLAGTS